MANDFQRKANEATNESTRARYQKIADSLNDRAEYIRSGMKAGTTNSRGEHINN
jgi:hypothetical protein